MYVYMDSQKRYYDIQAILRKAPKGATTCKKKSTVPSGKPKNVFKDQMWSHVSELDLIYWNCGRKIIIESDI